ncbi:MAG: Na/Pi cotransporter family protein [Cyanobacteria bacterium SIG32]|nr:Na/Pi cotransporter family protein [Cyanobacteria bacterium SIG32]
MESFNLFCILELLGGLAFFLYGMHIMSASLEKIAGGKLEKILKTMTSNPLKGLTLGVGVTAVIQSSSAVTVMLVGLVNSGLMKLSQAIGVIMGSNIGTTATAWILSLAGLEGDNPLIKFFKPDSLTPLLAFVGMLMFFVAKSNKNKSFGTVFLGFSILMTGMIFMSSSMSPLSNCPKFVNLLTLFDNPLFGVAIGTLLTAIIQSSSVSVGMLQALALKVNITCGAALPIIMGQNIGTCITAIISSVGVNSNAKKVAVVHLSFNILGTLIFLILFLIGNSFFKLQFVNEVANPANIAVIHSIFNIGTTLLLLPFVKVLEKIANLVIKEETESSALVLDERLLLSPDLALFEVKEKVVEMVDMIKSNLIYSTKLFKNYNPKKVLVITNNENLISSYENELKSFLIKISNKELAEENSQKIAQLLMIINDFQQINMLSKEILAIAEQKTLNKITFSDELISDLKAIVQANREIIRSTTEIVKKTDLILIGRVEVLKQNLSELVYKAKNKHIKNIQNGSMPLEFDNFILNLFTNLERVSEHCINICVLKKQNKKIVNSACGTI